MVKSEEKKIRPKAVSLANERFARAVEKVFPTLVLPNVTVALADLGWQAKLGFASLTFALAVLFLLGQGCAWRIRRTDCSD